LLSLMMALLQHQMNLRFIYADYAAVGQVQNWSFEISRAEIDVTTIGQAVGQYAPFKAYIPGFADGNGSASVFVTNEDSALSNRMVEDVLQRQASWLQHLSCTPIRVQLKH
jgi:hypothetical protein